MSRQLHNNLYTLYADTMSRELLNQQPWEILQKRHVQLVDNLDLQFRRENKHLRDYQQHRDLDMLHLQLRLSWEALRQWFLEDHQIERDIISLERKRERRERFILGTQTQIHRIQGSLDLFLNQATELRNTCLLHLRKAIETCDHTKLLYEKTAKRIQDHARSSKKESWLQGVAMSIAMIALCVVFSQCTVPIVGTTGVSTSTLSQSTFTASPVLLSRLGPHFASLTRQIPTVLSQLKIQTTLPDILGLVVPHVPSIPPATIPPAALPVPQKSFFSRILDRFLAAQEYVDALHDLPPTYRAMEEVGLKQWFPDPVSRESMKMKLDRVNEAERALGIEQ